MFSLPDKGEGQNDIQSILFQEYLDILLAGIAGVDCVLSGGAVTAQGTPDMTVAVAKAATLTNSVMKATVAGNGTITTADATNPRLDLVVINSSGAIAVRAGTAAAAPKPPARTANDVVLAVVYVPANDTTIVAAQITDLRVAPPKPTIIYRTTTTETTNTAGTVELLNKANSGVTIPSGLFLTGKILRVRMGGNMLLNSGTGTTNAIAIRYGAVTMFSNVETVAQAASTIRIAWFLDFDIAAQGNADQALSGVASFNDFTITRVAPAAGIGQLFQNNSAFEQPPAFSGAGIADSDTADRLLSVLWTMTSNAANEVVVKSATVELL